MISKSPRDRGDRLHRRAAGRTGMALAASAFTDAGGPPAGGIDRWERIGDGTASFRLSVLRNFFAQAAVFARMTCELALLGALGVKGGRVLATSGTRPACVVRTSATPVGLHVYRT